MPRRPRRPSESGIHHVMNRGVDHQPIFFNDVDRLEMGLRLAAIHETFSVTTIAYCLMGNHIHLVLHAPDGAVSEAMHHLTSVYSRHVNDRLGRDGPLVRGRFHSIPVESDTQLLTVTRYVHRNPLDIRDVHSPRDYRWSSYRTYLGLRPPPTFLDRQPVMNLVGGRIDELAAMTEDASSLRPHTVGDLTGLIRCGRAVQELVGDLDPHCLASVERTVLVLLAERTCDPALLRLIEEALGPRTDEAARQALRRAKARHRADDAVASALAWVEHQLSGTAAVHAVPGTA